MIAEIISIGSELTSGQNLDTNSQWLSRRLAEIGIPVASITRPSPTISNANVEVFRIGKPSGRTGPRNRRARPNAGRPDPRSPRQGRRRRTRVASNRRWIISARCLRSRSRTMPERNSVQAFIPGRGRADSERTRHRARHLDADRRYPARRHAGRAERNVRHVRIAGQAAAARARPRRRRTRSTQDQLLRRRRIRHRGKGARPDAPRSRPGGRHHRVRRHHIASHPRQGGDGDGSRRPRSNPSSEGSASGSATWSLAWKPTTWKTRSCRCCVREIKRLWRRPRASPPDWWPSRLGRVPGVSEWFRGGIVAYHNDAQDRTCSTFRPS